MRSAEFQARPLLAGPLGAVTLRARRVHLLEDRRSPRRRDPFEINWGRLTEASAGLECFKQSSLECNRRNFRARPLSARPDWGRHRPPSAPRGRKQAVQQSLFHAAWILECFKQSSIAAWLGFSLSHRGHSESPPPS